MEVSKKNNKVIDLRVLLRKLGERKRLFAITLPIVFVLSCLYIICIPRYYKTDTKMAPEMESSIGEGTLSSIASSFGFDLDNMQTSDAITPILYPDLMEDNGFVSKFLEFQVESADGEIKTNYHDYLSFHQKYAWWIHVLSWIKSLLPQKEEKRIGKGGNEHNPYILSKKEDEIMNAVRKNIALSFDKKTGVITATVTDQDKLICKTIADSVSSLLQRYITEYRTNKARIDLQYFKQLTADAKHEYEKARQLYGSYSDANTDVVLQSFRSKQEDLENDMQLKFNAYSVLNTQLQQAKAKVQEKTPAFTVIKGASVPIKPAGPKRMIFVITMVILSAIIISIYALKDIIISENEEDA